MHSMWSIHARSHHSNQTKPPSNRTQKTDLLFPINRRRNAISLWLNASEWRRTIYTKKKSYLHWDWHTPQLHPYAIPIKYKMINDRKCSKSHQHKSIGLLSRRTISVHWFIYRFFCFWKITRNENRNEKKNVLRSKPHHNSQRVYSVSISSRLHHSIHTTWRTGGKHNDDGAFHAGVHILCECVAQQTAHCIAKNAVQLIFQHIYPSRRHS